jgi:hypothetical protein
MSINLQEVTKDWRAQLGLLILVCTVTSVLVLLLDFKIKNDLIREAEKFRVLVDTAGPNGQEKGGRIPSGANLPTRSNASFASNFRGGPMVADNAGVEAQASNGSLPQSLYGSDLWTVVSGE